MGIFDREPDAAQETWIAMQRCIAETIRQRVLDEGQQVLTAQDADFLADHIADDLRRLGPMVPPEHWVPREKR